MKRRTMAILAVLSVLLFRLPNAFAVPQHHFVGWGLADTGGSYLEGRGVIGYITPLKNVYVPADKISSMTVASQTADGLYWMRTGWYKGSAWGGTCLDPSSVIRVFAESYKTGDATPYQCVSDTTHSVGVADKYDILATNCIPSPVVCTWAAFHNDGLALMFRDLPANSMRQYALGHIWDEPTPTTELYSRAATLQYVDSNGGVHSWPNHILSYYSSYYTTYQEATDQVRICNEPPDLSVCHL